jgi:multisubunit Na+/H+ antiporter MnhG subunit
VEVVWNLYGPWLKIMLQIGVSLLLLGTLAMFFFERGYTPRRLIGRIALWGWALVLLALALYFIIHILQDAFTSLPGT